MPKIARSRAARPRPTPPPPRSLRELRVSTSQRILRPWRRSASSAATADPRGDDPRLVARVHRRDGRHRGAPDHRGGSRARPDGPAVDLPLLLAGARRPSTSSAARSATATAAAGSSSRARPASRSPPCSPAPRRTRPRSSSRGRSQGVAGAFLTTNSLALLRGVYGAESGRAIGLWTSFTSVATIAGPPAGGALVEWVSWRWIFLLNLPLAAATVVLALAGALRRGPARAPGQARPRRSGPGGRGLRAASPTGSSRAPTAASARSGGPSWAQWPRSRRSSSSSSASHKPMLPFELFRRPELRGGERADVPRLRRALRVLRLLHDLPAVPRLHAVRGRAAEHPARASS